jgi:hypothetical protein
MMYYWMEMRISSSRTKMKIHNQEKDAARMKTETEFIPLQSMFLSMKITLGGTDHGEMSLATLSWMMSTFLKTISI